MSEITLQNRILRFQYLDWFVAGVIILIGVALRTVQINYSLHLDEILTVSFAQQPLLELLTNWPEAAHPPLYLVALNLWLELFANPEPSARLLSVLFSTLFLFFAYTLLRRITTTNVALLCLTILCFSSMFVSLGQQARPYSFLLMLQTLNFLALLSALQNRDSVKQLAIWSLSCTLLVYTHYFSAIVVFLQAIIILTNSQHARWRTLAYCMAPFVAIAVWLSWTVLPTLIDPSSGASELEVWEVIAWVRKPSLYDFAWFYTSVFGDYPDILQNRWVLTCVVLLLSIGLSTTLLRGRISGMHVAFAGAAFLLPLCLYFLSVFGPTSVWVPRQMITAALGLVVLMAVFLKYTSRYVTVVGLSFLAIVSVLSVPNALPEHRTTPWESIVAIVSGKGDRLPIVTNERWVELPLNYYLRSNATQQAELVESPTADQYLVCRKKHCDSMIDMNPHLEFRLLFESTDIGSVNAYLVIER